MGAYAYCCHKGCEYGLDKPTPREVVQDDWRCRLGHWNEMRAYDKDDLIVEMADRIDELEERMAQIEEALSKLIPEK